MSPFSKILFLFVYNSKDVLGYWKKDLVSFFFIISDLNMNMKYPSIAICKMPSPHDWFKVSARNRVQGGKNSNEIKNSSSTTSPLALSNDIQT
jgi:hypothetical protein